MALRCVAIDDEPLALRVIETYVAQLPALHLVQTFDDALSAAEFIRQAPVDLLFLDIDMPDISGLDLLRSLQTKPLVIFTTAHRQYAYEGFELAAIDFLLKPIDLKRFSRAVQKAVEYHAYQNRKQEEEPVGLFVHSEYRLLKIDFRDILYIESLEDYIRIHLRNGKPVLTLLTMKKVLEKLPALAFRRIHRSYIVPVAQVAAIANRKLQLTSGTELPISDSYADFIKDWKKSQDG